jgi:cytochrome oxidase assembly protein ShyY1
VEVSWRFARRPSWVLRHLLVAALVAVAVAAGFWQIDRLDTRRADNALITARMAEAPAEVSTVIPLDASVAGDELDAVRYRPVLARGTYLVDETVMVEHRTFNGAPGGWVLTPLLLEDGTAVVVNRGFIGFTRAGDLAAPDPPSGEVVVEGLVQLSEQRGRMGAVDPAGGRVEALIRVDLGRIAAQLDVPLRPAYVQLRASAPPEPEPAPGAPVLLALPAPDLGEGPHLSYAVQWFIFATIGLVGYPLILRRVAQQEARERAATLAAGGKPASTPAGVDTETGSCLSSH